MPKKRFVSGVIDVVTIIGVLFLIVTLGVGTYVVANKDSKLNLGSRAKAIIEGVDIRNPELQKQIKEVKQKQKEREEDNEGGNNNPDPVPPPTSPITTDNCYADCINISGNTPGECNMACGQSTYTAPGGGNQTLPPDENPVDILPVVTQPTTPPTASGCNLNGNTVAETVTVVFSSGANDYRRCVDGSWITDCNQSQSGIQACTLADVSSGAVPAYLLAQYNQEVQRLSNECTASGKVWIGNSCITAESTIETVDLSRFGEENETTIVTNYTDSRGNIIYTDTQHDIDVQSRIEVVDLSRFREDPVTQSVTEIRNSDGNLLSRSVTPLDIEYTRTIARIQGDLVETINTIVRNGNTGEILNYLTQPITPQTYNNQQNVTAESLGCGKPGLTQEQRDECTNIARVSAYNNPITGRYIQSFSNPNNIFQWQQLGYNSSEEAIQSCVDKNGIGAAYGCMKQMTGYGSEQVASSVQLGTTGTALAAVMISPLGWGTGALTGVQAISLGMAASTVYQTGSAVDICAISPGSSECKNSAFWATVSWVNIGTSAMGNQTVNSIVNALNIGADGFDIAQSCGEGQFASGFGCTMAYVGIFFDVGQGGSDIARVIDNNIGGLSGTLGALPDVNANIIPDTNRVFSQITNNTIDPITTTPTMLNNAVVQSIPDVGPYSPPSLAGVNDVINPPTMTNALDNIQPTGVSAQTGNDIFSMIFRPADAVSTSETGGLGTQISTRDIAQFVENNIYSSTGGVLPFLNRIAAPSSAVDLTLAPTTSITTRIGDWVNKIIKPNTDYFERYGKIQPFADITNENLEVLQSELEVRKTIVRDNTILNKDRDTELANFLIDKTNGPVIEIGGPTLSGYKIIDIQSLKKPITVTNIDGGVKLEGIGLVGIADKKLDATNMNLKTNSVGSFISKSLPKSIYPEYFSEAYKALEPGGIIIIDGTARNSGLIPIAESNGFKFVKSYVDSDSQVGLVFQKPGFESISEAIEFRTAGVWDGVKKGWNNFVESNWNPLNWIGGGSPAGDPVAIELPESKISRHFTETPIENPRILLSKIEEYQKVVLNEFDLPHPNLRQTNPNLYYEQLMAVVDRYGIQIRSFDEIPEQFKNQAPNNSFYDDSWGTDSVYLKNPSSNDPEELKKAVHEIQHALDYKFNDSSYPIEWKEYRAYMAEYNLDGIINETDGELQKTLAFIFGDRSIAGSTRYYLNQNQVTTMPWDKTIAVGNLPNSFIVTDPYGKSSWVRDVNQSDITPEFNQHLNEIEYLNFRYYYPDQNKGIIEFTGFRQVEGGGVDDIVPVITGRSIGSGGTRNAILITDHEKGISWVMYEYDRSGWDGAELQLEPIAKGINIPIDNIEGGAYRYLPIENNLSLFPDELKKKYKIIEFISPFVDLINPFDMIGRIVKNVEKAQWKHQGADMGELHNANVVFVVWDQKPKSDFTLPIIRLRPYIINNNNVFLPGISWVRVETIEVRISEGGAINSNYNPLIAIFSRNPLTPSAGVWGGIKNWWFEKGPPNWFGGFGSPADDPVVANTNESLIKGIFEDPMTNPQQLGDKIIVSEYGLESYFSRTMPDKYTTWVTIYDQEHISDSQALGFLWRNLPGGDKIVHDINKLSNNLSGNADLNILVHSYGTNVGTSIPAEVVAFNGSDYNATQFGQMLVDHGVSNKKVKSVKLISCNTGVCGFGEDSFAQKVANVTGVPVSAPTGYVQTGITSEFDVAPMVVYRTKSIANGEPIYSDVVPKNESFKTFYPRSGNGFSGQVFIEYSAALPLVIAAPAAVLYYTDQYFDLGLYDYLVNSINEALNVSSTDDSVNIEYLIWKYTRDQFLGAQAIPNFQPDKISKPINIDFGQIQTGYGSGSSLKSCESLGENFLNESDCKSSFSFGSDHCIHPYYNNEPKYCCPTGQYSKSIDRFGLLNICIDVNPKKLNSCPTQNSICSADPNDHYGSKECWSTNNHMEEWCCGSDELYPDGSCKVYINPYWQKSL